jgi:hypothetical protein
MVQQLGQVILEDLAMPVAIAGPQTLGLAAEAANRERNDWG